MSESSDTNRAAGGLTPEPEPPQEMPPVAGPPPPAPDPNSLPDFDTLPEFDEGARTQPMPPPDPPTGPRP